MFALDPGFTSHPDGCRDRKFSKFSELLGNERYQTIKTWGGSLCSPSQIDFHPYSSDRKQVVTRISIPFLPSGDKLAASLSYLLQKRTEFSGPSAYTWFHTCDIHDRRAPVKPSWLR